MFFREYECSNGKKYILPVNHCAFCENCVSILYDFTHGPYMFMCELGLDLRENCRYFKEEKDDQ